MFNYTGIEIATRQESFPELSSLYFFNQDLLQEVVMNLCECGCGQECKNRFVNGHNWRGKERGERSEEYRKKLSKAAKGRPGYWVGKKHSEETKRKISENQIGKKHSEETKRKMSEAHKGWEVSEETRKKISEANKGRIMSQEWRNKIAIAMINKGRSDDYCSCFFDKEFAEYLRNDICSICEMTNEESLSKWGISLDRHHIDDDKKNNHPDNIDTLCKSCHAKKHNRLRRLKKINYDKTQ